MPFFTSAMAPRHGQLPSLVLSAVLVLSLMDNSALAFVLGDEPAGATPPERPGGPIEESGEVSYPTPPEGARKVVIVGNGESLRGSRLGAVIDTYETVGRFNHFRTTGFETDVGAKTTVWVLAQIRDPDAMDADEVKDIEMVLSPFVMRPCEDQMRPCAPESVIPKKLAEGKKKMALWKDKITESPVVPKSARVSVTSMPENEVLYDKYGLVEKFPSSGLQVINWFVQKYGRVSIAGFDFERGSHQHYWERKMKDETCHNMNGEAKIIDAMMAEGVVTRLGKRPSAAELREAAYDPDCKIICNEETRTCAKITGNAFKKYNTMKVAQRKMKTVAFWKALQISERQKQEQEKQDLQRLDQERARMYDPTGLFKGIDLGIGIDEHRSGRRGRRSRPSQNRLGRRDRLRGGSR